MSFYDSDDDDVNEIEDQEILHTPPTDGLFKISYY